ncbi:MAG: ThiF family adenylyltransferase [Myxococcota bacterium]
MSTKLLFPLELTGYRDNPSRANIVVVGCGGTGGFLVPNLARLLANLPDFEGTLTLLDGDVVETKNLTRQNFISADLGAPKAQVLAERYSAAFGTRIAFCDQYLKGQDMLESLTPNTNRGANIVVGCVDNHRTRQVIARWFRKRRGRIWIDAGNEELTGQVICGINLSPYNPYRKTRKGKSQKLFGLPCVADLFPEVEGDKKAVFNDERSCAERAAENPQNIATNIMAANALLVYLQQVLLGQGLRSHGVFFSAQQASTDLMLNLPERLDVRSWPGYKGKIPFVKTESRTSKKAARRKAAEAEMARREEASMLVAKVEALTQGVETSAPSIAIGLLNTAMMETEAAAARREEGA